MLEILFAFAPKGSSALGPLKDDIASAFVCLQKSIGSHSEVRGPQLNKWGALLLGKRTKLRRRRVVRERDGQCNLSFQDPTLSAAVSQSPSETP